MAILVLSAPASATYDPIGSGEGVITLDKAFAKTLKKGGIKLSGRKGAKVKGAAISMPAIGGKADPTIEKGEIDLGGELFFKHQKQNLNVRQVSLKTKPTPVFAKVSGGQLKLVKAAKVTLERDGFGNRLVATKLKLTEKSAVRLNRKLHTEAFFQGQVLGSLKAPTQPQTVTIQPAGALSLTLDPAMVAKLNANSISVNSTFPAEHVGPAFSFPIVAGGQLAPDGSSGTLRTGGSVELLHLGTGQMFWKELWFDLGGPFATSEESVKSLGPQGKVTRDLGRVPFADFKVPSGGFAANPGARTIAVSGAQVPLQPETAALLNDGLAEGKQEFHAGELLGTVAFSAQGQ